MYIKKKVNNVQKRCKLKGLTYNRMITTAKQGNNNLIDDNDEDEPDDNDKNKNKKGKKTNNTNTREFVPWDRIKAKFATVYDENLKPEDQKDLCTQVYVGTKEDPENCKTVSDIEMHFTWKCKAQFALMFNKVWIKRSGDNGCGIGIKCVQIGITEPSERRASTNRQINKRLFPSSAAFAAPVNKTQEKPEEKSTEKTTGTKSSKTPISTNKKNQADETVDDTVDDTDNQNDNQNENQDDQNNNDENQDENQEQTTDNGNASEPEDDEDNKTKKTTKNTKTTDVKVKVKNDKNTKGQTDKKTTQTQVPKKVKNNK